MIVHKECPGHTVVGFLDPQIMAKQVGKNPMQTVADQAAQRLRRVCASLGGSSAA